MHWYDWHTVTERLQGRAYALTRGKPYKVVLDPSTSTGTCDFTNKKILINPNLFSDVFQNKGLSGHSLDKANYLVSRAVTGHESLHVLYSDPKVVLEATEESATLKTILNLLEDARIERIGSGQSHVSKTLFRFVNRIAGGQLREFRDNDLSDRYSVVHLLLRWRLDAQIPRLEPAAQQLWEQVLHLATRALYARDCAEVFDLARQIVKLAALDTPDTPDSGLDKSDEVMKRTQSAMTGSRDSDPLPNPATQEYEPAAEPAPPATQDDSYKDGGMDGATGPDDAVPDSEATDGGEAPADGHAVEPDADQTASHSVSSNGDAHSDTTQPSSADSEDLERLVDETAIQVSEDLDALVPQVSSDDNKLVAKSVPFRGRCYSDVVASPYADYLREAAPIAAELVRELKTESPRGSNGPSESPGRFRTRYYVRDSTRPFSAQRFQGITIPKMALSLVIDRSGSMEHIVHELRTMSMAIAIACEGLHIPLSIWALEGQVHIKHFEETGPQVLAKIAGIPADTLTRTMPTLRDAVADLKSRPEELKQIVMIHDGMPSDRLDFIAWRNELRGIGLFCMFIMPEDQYRTYMDCPEQLRQSMDELVGPRNYAIAPVVDIAKHWCSFIRGRRTQI